MGLFLVSFGSCFLLVLRCGSGNRADMDSFAMFVLVHAFAPSFIDPCHRS